MTPTTRHRFQQQQQQLQQQQLQQQSSLVYNGAPPGAHIDRRRSTKSPAFYAGKAVAAAAAVGEGGGLMPAPRSHWQVDYREEKQAMYTRLLRQVERAKHDSVLLGRDGPELPNQPLLAWRTAWLAAFAGWFGLPCFR